MSSSRSNSDNGGACDAFMEALDGFIGGLIGFERLRLTTSLLLDGDFSEAEDMQAALDSALRDGYLDRTSYRVLSTLIELETSEDEPTESPRHSGDLLSTPATRIPDIAAEPDDVGQSNELTPGMTLRDRFTLLEQIDSGSMGKIFKAVDCRKEESGSDSPWVAIKSITAALSNPPDAPVALQKEAANAQSLSHPNIIRVFDFDRDGEHVFMTMELLEGASLAELLNQHRFRPYPGEQARSIIEDVCRGLIYAHDLGIIHADVKPGNIFVTRNECVKLLDFGISVTVSDDADGSEVYAHTPSYASCEVLEGAAPTAQDDVYSLACVAYRILAGHRAFDGATANVAETENLELKPVDDISPDELAALRRATAFRRADRTTDVLSFLNEFLNKPEFSLAATVEQPDDTTPGRPYVNIRKTVGLLAVVASIVAIAVAIWPVGKMQNRDAGDAAANSNPAITAAAKPEVVGPPIEYRATAKEESEQPIAPEPPNRVAPVKVSKAPTRQIEKPDPIRELAELTDASLDKGFLLAPAYGSAKYYLTEMRTIDPEADEFTDARQRFANLMMLEVMVAIADEDFDTAAELIAETRSVGAGAETTERYESALAKAREASLAREADSLTAMFAGASPAVLANLDVELLPVADLLPDADWSLQATDGLSTEQTPVAQEYAPADDIADDPGASAGEIAENPDESAADQSPDTLPLSALEFRRHVQPQFPRWAADRNISGWVDLRFLVNAQGKTANIEIMDAEPKGSFEKAATRAVSKWRFEPVMVDGAPAEKFSVVRVRFDSK